MRTSAHCRPSCLHWPKTTGRSCSKPWPKKDIYIVRMENNNEGYELDEVNITTDGVEQGPSKEEQERIAQQERWEKLE